MSDKIELKPCPFCGSENFFADDDGFNTTRLRHKVGCFFHSAKGPKDSWVEEGEEEKWNTRHGDKK